MTAQHIRATPLGGVGRIGGNLMVYETRDDLVVVDCGMSFPSTAEPGVDRIIPDVSYIEERLHKLRAFLITHGHEDHIGALPYVLAKCPAPVWATRFTRALIRQRLGEHPDVDLDLRDIDDGVDIQVGGIRVQPIPVTHSIPDAVSFALHTAAGTVIHTGDFKIDPSPLDNRLTDEKAFRALGDAGVTALFSDSTSAEKEGHTWSERAVADTFVPLIQSLPFRVVVTTFSSNIFRLQAIVDASIAADRKIIGVGRSVIQNLQIAREMGAIKAPDDAFVDVKRFASLPRSAVTIIATGCQGEQFSALSRIAANEHGQIRLEPHDSVIFSARRIPGNERAVGAVINQLARLGADIIDDRRARVHTSGHGFNDEQRKMLEWCRPHYFVPVHGEYRHMTSHAALAHTVGVPEDRVILLDPGDPVEFTAPNKEGKQGGQKSDAMASVKRPDRVHAGDIFIDGSTHDSLGSIVLRDRRILNESGFVCCVLTLDTHGRAARRPEIITRGVFHIDANPDLIEEAADAVLAVVDTFDSVTDEDERFEAVRLCLRRFFRVRLGRRPLLLPTILNDNDSYAD